MKAGLRKSGMTTEQASCYSNVLKPLVKAEVFNDFATFLMQGKTLKESIKKMRLKHGENFVDGMSSGRKKFDACLK